MRTILAAATCIFILSAIVWLSSWKFDKHEEKSSPVEVVVSDPEIPEGFDGDYGAGYRNGYHAFMAQELEERGMVAVSYASLPERPSEEGSAESFNKGYVDGYHRATAAASCICDR